MNPGRSKSTRRETRSKKITNVFSALQILLFREENSRQSRSLYSHSSFCEEVFSRSEPDWRIPESVYSERGPKTLKSGFSVTLANEADRFEYSGSWLAARRSFGLTFFPPSPLFGTRTFCLCAKRTLYPPFLLQRSWNSAGCTDYKSMFHSQTIGLWEIVSSYSSATAPASHRIPRADPLFQTRKELSEQ